MMNKRLYKEIVSKHKLKPKKIKHCVWAFLCGGLTAVVGQLLIDLYIDLLNISNKDAISLMLLTIILLTNIFTAIGVFDKYSNYAGAGAFIPISGFANALTSASLEGRSEGLIFGIGSNMFRLAGSVLVYGISSSIIYGFIYYLLSLAGVTI